MSKKSGRIIKLVAFVAGVAAIGVACYIYKDKIKEFFEKIQLKEKIESAKKFISEKIMGNKDEDFFDDADFFDDEEFEEEDATNRGYTSITITTEEEEADAPAEEPVAPSVEPVSFTAPAVEETTEDIPYEYEGLSDVSEDEEVLEEEASLDGSL